MVDKPVEALAPGQGDALAPGNGHDGGRPAADTERILAETLADVVHVEQVPVEGDFFTELGADSLVMAHFCARVRKRGDLPPVSMRDVYRHPTVRDLARALADDAPAPLAPAGTPAAAPTTDRTQGRTPDQAPEQAPDQALGRPPARAGRASTQHYVLCGALQLLVFLCYAYLLAFVTARGYEWVSDASGPVEVYLRTLAFGGAVFTGACVLPIVVKWLLVGRWRPGRIPVWSLAYVRFWIVKTLVRSDPLVLFVGSPLYLLYLRALGARIGPGAAVFSRTVPVCTDLLTVGAGTVVRKDCFFSCYQAHDGVIRTGPVTLGRDVLVSEATVIDIGTSMGDGSQLGHASSLHTGQAVPAGERWHGSPAQPGTADFRVAGPARCGRVRRTVHGVLQLLLALLVYVPLAVGGVVTLLAEVPQLATVLEPGPAVLTSWTFYRDALVFSAALVFLGAPAGLLVLVTVPRLLARAVPPGRDHPLYGIRYSVHRTILLMTNIRFFKRLFGDSSAIVHYLRTLGYDLSRIEQTGSNFGTEVKHETPFLCTVGTGTMVADGLSVVNADFSNTAFRVSRTSIGPYNFLGNRIAYPTRGRTGGNCLLATKVMVPVDGQVREGVGLLGSPSFEIPRSVERDARFDRLKTGAELRRGLAAKNRHNAATMGCYLLTRWLYVFGVSVLASGAANLYAPFGTPAIALADVLVLLLTTVYFVLVERLLTARHAPGPLFSSIYDRRFWLRERYWKVPSEGYARVFNGTPFKSVLWRLLGVRIGRRVFDDGCALTERPMVAIGDGCTLNAGSVIQCHSQEDGTFKSDRTTVGSGCTLGVGALVHYGVTVGDGAVLAPDSFLMKGETVTPHTWWGGNPARQFRQPRQGNGELGGERRQAP